LDLGRNNRDARSLARLEIERAMLLAQVIKFADRFRMAEALPTVEDLSGGERQRYQNKDRSNMRSPDY